MAYAPIFDLNLSFAAPHDGAGSDLPSPTPPLYYPMPLSPHELLLYVPNNPPVVVDLEASMPPPEIDNGLPEEVIARFLKTAVCDKAAAADGGDRELCAVCLDDLHQEDRAVGVLRCRHGFHGDCIRGWLRKKNVCPLCRATAVDI